VLSLLLDVVAAALLLLGLAVMTLGLYGVLRMPEIYLQLHAASLVSGLGVTAILLAALGTGNGGVMAGAAVVAVFLLLTAPISSHAIAWAAYRRGHDEGLATGDAGAEGDGHAGDAGAPDRRPG
jgi:multicomponent Na+:H+ antiporter subunit G